MNTLGVQAGRVLRLPRRHRNGDPRIARLLLEQRCDPDASNMQLGVRKKVTLIEANGFLNSGLQGYIHEYSSG